MAAESHSELSDSQEQVAENEKTKRYWVSGADWGRADINMLYATTRSQSDEGGGK